jgi:AcrR family transcriptional regulator
MGRASREPEIRDAALRSFARLGYEGTRVRHIAEEAGVSDAALYRHWKSKEELAAAVFADGMRAYAAELEQAAGSEGDAETRFTRLLERMLDLYRDQPTLSVFLVEHQPRFMHTLPPDFPYPVHVVEQLVKAGQREKSVRRGDPRLLAAMVLGCVMRPVLMHRYAQSWRFDPGSRAQRKLVTTGAWSAIAAG